jgi:hypothetical protein
MSKRTVEELQKAAEAAEKRAKELRAQARRITQAEEAKQNAEVIKALHEWIDSFPQERRIAWSELPDYYRRQAANNREKYKQV